MRIFKALARIIKGVYDILAGYLLAWVVLFAFAAYGLQVLLTYAVAFADFDSVNQFWAWASHRLSLSPLTIRLCGSGLVHLSWLLILRKPLIRCYKLLDRGISTLEKRLEGWGRRHGKARLVWSFSFTALVTVLLVPFVIQPTLVPRSWQGKAWAARAANLADGTASATFVESVVGLYRRMGAAPVASQGVSKDQLEVAFPEDNGESIPIQDWGDPGNINAPPPPLKSSFMDRWDPIIKEVVGKDRRAFALVKALIWVESAGRQFAVSRTGCVGLTQFCSRTARALPYRKVFDLGQVYPCNCNGKCSISRSVQKDLESGDMSRLLSHKETFPCDLSDARFDPKKAVTAAWIYAKRMLNSFGGNIYLVYIGYNSGPAVSARVWKAAGRDRSMELPLIKAHLAGALRPYFGASAEYRARSLVRGHLPKLRAAYQRYLGKKTPPYI